MVPTAPRDATFPEDAPVCLFSLEDHSPGASRGLTPLPEVLVPLTHLGLLQKTTRLPPKPAPRPEGEAAEQNVGLTLPWSCCVSLTWSW